MIVPLLYLIAIMILYDFSLHVMETIHGNKEKAMKKWYCWPPAKIFNNHGRRFYNYFWTFYWGLAFILLIIAIVL